MKKILITGNKGFIGSNLSFPNDQVMGWDLVSGRDIYEAKFEQMVEDCDIVIHLAALTNVEGSKKHPKDFYTTNVLGTARVLQACLKHNKKLIYPSTLHVNYPQRSPYAMSKALAEMLVLGAMAHFDKIVLLRLFNVFGPGMNNNSGSVINLFLKSKKIEVWGEGKAKRDYIHVKDVARIIEQATGKSWNDQIVELGMGKGYPLKKVAELFAKYRKMKVDYLPGKKEIAWPNANTKALKNLYKGKLTTDLEKDIKELVELYYGH